MTNDIILIDGIRYCRYTPKSEAEFRQLVVDNIAELFGKEAIYIDIEKNLENEIGKARRPDGFVLDLSSNSFYVVEFELSNHSTYGHIDPQINGFLQAVDNWNTRQKIAGILKKYMEEDVVRLKSIKDHIGDTSELYQFFLERVLTPMHNSGQPNTYIIIDECCDELQLAMRHRTPKPKIIEAAVYAREGAEAVKALRFEPQYKVKSNHDMKITKSSSIQSEIYVPEITRGSINYLQFYTELTERFKSDRQIRKHNPKRDCFYHKIFLGIGGIHYEWSFHDNPPKQFCVELHFEKGDKKDNLKFLTVLQNKIEDIEKALGEKVYVKKDWGKKWAKLFIERPITAIDESLKKWALDKMSILINETYSLLIEENKKG